VVPLLGLVAVLLVFVATPMPAKAASDPGITASAVSGAAGDVILVTLVGFPDTTTVTVCGNQALRGAVDCNLPGSIAVGASAVKPQSREMIITTPPTLCPCVLRAATTAENLVRTVPFTVLGVGTGPLVGQAPSTGSGLSVVAKVVGSSTSLIDAVRSALGGETARTLVLTVTNVSASSIGDISVTAAVGRSSQSGEPLQPPVLEALGPGETKVLNLNATLSAPALGSYVVFGTVYAHGAAVSFSARTSNTPVLLYALIVLLVVDVLAIGIIRLRRRWLGRYDDDAYGDGDDADDDELAPVPART
jgi:hypothetical protein